MSRPYRRGLAYGYRLRGRATLRKLEEGCTQATSCDDRWCVEMVAKTGLEGKGKHTGRPVAFLQERRKEEESNRPAVG